MYLCCMGLILESILFLGKIKGIRIKNLKMIVLLKNYQRDIKEVHCPVCGERLCDLKVSENVVLCESDKKSEIILKCYKCKNKIEKY